MDLLNYYGVVSKHPLGFEFGVLSSFVFFSVYVLVRGKRNKTGDSSPNHGWTSDWHLGFTYHLHFEFFFVCCIIEKVTFIRCNILSWQETLLSSNKQSFWLLTLSVY